MNMLNNNLLRLTLDDLNKLSSSSFVGFDRFIDRLNNFPTQDKIGGFPPYNISKYDNDKYTIELALAGYSKKDIEISVEKGVLSIVSNKTTDPTTQDGVLHKGISTRKFTREFTLAEDIVVKDAAMENGMLTIWLERVVPEDKKRLQIPIK